MLPLVGSAYNVGGGRIISANDASAGMSITQSGSGHILDLTGPSGLEMSVQKNETDIHSKVFVPAAPDATPNYGLFNLGNGPWDGTSAGHFVGNARGQLIAGNAASGFLGDLINIQIAGASTFGVNSTGSIMGYELYDSTGSCAFRVNGGTCIATNYGNASVVSLVARGYPTQSTDIQQWQRGAGNPTVAGINSSGTIYTTAGIAAARRTVTTTDQATINDYSLWCDATAAAFTETLPAANTCKNGQMIAATKIDSSANAVTVKGSGTDTVNGAASIALSAAGSTAILITDGVSKWWEIG